MLQQIECELGAFPSASLRQINCLPEHKHPMSGENHRAWQVFCFSSYETNLSCFPKQDDDRELSPTCAAMHSTAVWKVILELIYRQSFTALFQCV